MNVADLRAWSSRFCFRVGRVLSGATPGLHGAAARGAGLVFAVHREYQHGDDIRLVDWKVAARLGRPLVKLFEEERGASLMIVLDGSASMRSPDARKWRAACETAGLLAFVAARQGDAVGAVIVTSEVEAVWPVRRGMSHAEALVRSLDAVRPRHDGSSIGTGIATAVRGQLRGGAIAVVSDFLARQWPSAIRRAAVRHAVVGIHVVAPGERSLPAAGVLRVRDVETGACHWVDTACGETRRRYAERAAARSRAIRRGLVEAGATAAEIDAADPRLRGLRAFLRPVTC